MDIWRKDVTRSLVVSDSAHLLNGIIRVCAELCPPGVEIACSNDAPPDCGRLAAQHGLKCYDLLRDEAAILLRFTVLIGVHCLQILPPSLVRQLRCINFHPGYNPYNRGWFPHVFSMINGLPAGITIHEMDERIDHGPVIYREQLPIHPYETSKDFYERLVARELDLLKEFLPVLLTGNYEAKPLESEGNYNSRSAFESAKHIDPDRTWIARDFLNFLRALSYEGYRNAYVVDPQTREKYYLRLVIEREGEVSRPGGAPFAPLH